ncbi:hypothetical protein RFI_26189 [Reticulomyxa filosa]|uniref:Uncharacterized protein n=1 Tax=Reticulomyxa filosa TaxID=46433 RepID=X6MCK7_RETFI|nr:hypothetical protein RFI_26189 [Reticulomyxa filosa]|eukprot:ETO11187.1 hypothetical protein RFI_26189 [Reticulomyxa filosa]
MICGVDTNMVLGLELSSCIVADCCFREVGLNAIKFDSTSLSLLLLLSVWSQQNRVFSFILFLYKKTFSNHTSVVCHYCCYFCLKISCLLLFVVTEILPSFLRRNPFISSSFFVFFLVLAVIYEEILVSIEKKKLVVVHYKFFVVKKKKCISCKICRNNEAIFTIKKLINKILDKSLLLLRYSVTDLLQVLFFFFFSKTGIKNINVNHKSIANKNKKPKN